MKKMAFNIEKKVKYLGVILTNMNCILFQNDYVKVWDYVKKEFAEVGYKILTIFDKPSFLVNRPYYPLIFNQVLYISKLFHFPFFIKCYTK